LAAFGAVLCRGFLSGQNNWQGFGNDPGQMRYSTRNQITSGNVSRLRQAWTWDSGRAGRKWETTPLVGNDVMYFTMPPGADGVVAVDPVMGIETMAGTDRIVLCRIGPATRKRPRGCCWLRGTN